MKHIVFSVICALACLPESSHAETEIPSITGKMITLKSNEHFTLLGDTQTTTGTRDGKEFKESKQLDTKYIGLHPSGLSKRGQISGTGYLYICKLKILNSEWHPSASKRLLGNIGYQIGQGIKVQLLSTTDTLMNEAGKGMVHLLQGDRASITIILIGTDDANIFHLCGTYTETKQEANKVRGINPASRTFP